MLSVDPSVPYSSLVPAPSAHPLVERFSRFVTDHNLLATNRPIVVGVSGGADSVALLHLLLAFRTHDLPDVQIHVAHLDHVLRGRESAEDAAAVARLAEAWNVPATV